MLHTPAPADAVQPGSEADLVVLPDKAATLPRVDPAVFGTDPDVPAGNEKAPSQAGYTILLIRLLIILITLFFVLGMVYLGCDPYLAITGGVALIAAAVRLTRQ